jgi:hypothetical protein
MNGQTKKYGDVSGNEPETLRTTIEKMELANEQGHGRWARMNRQETKLMINQTEQQEMKLANELKK